MPSGAPSEPTSLSRDEIAFESDVPAEFIDELISAELLRPDEDGRFPARYVRRIRLFHGITSAGVGTDRVRAIFDRRWGNLDTGDLAFPPSAPRSKRSVAEFMASLGDRRDILPGIWAILGLPEPDESDHLTIDDETTISSFLRVWGRDPTIAARAARVMATAVRQLVEGYMSILIDEYLRPMVEGEPGEVRDPPEVIDQIVPGLFEMFRWLVGRSIERGNIAVNVDNAEQVFNEQGAPWLSGRARRAVVFADVSGFTAETLQVGDARAAELALELHDLATKAAHVESGRLVKMFGDGAMLIFRTADSAARASRGLIAAWPAELPRLHIGIAVGPVLELDADAYGRTVNLAARLSAAAGAGQILLGSLPPDVTELSEPTAPVGRLELKGFAEPVEAVEIRQS